MLYYVLQAVSGPVGSTLIVISPKTYPAEQTRHDTNKKRSTYPLYVSCPPAQSKWGGSDVVVVVNDLVFKNLELSMVCATRLTMR